MVFQVSMYQLGLCKAPRPRARLQEDLVHARRRYSTRLLQTEQSQVQPSLLAEGLYLASVSTGILEGLKLSWQAGSRASMELQAWMKVPQEYPTIWTSGKERTSFVLSEAEAQKVCKKGMVQDVLGVMDQQGEVPSVQMYKNLLQACSKQKALAEAKLLHAHLVNNGLESSRFLGDLVVTTLVNCGSLDDGIQAFRKLPRRTVFSWTAVISAYSNAGQCRRALLCYEQMQQDGVQPDAYTFVSLIKACSKLGDLEKGQHVHAAALKHGLGSDVFVGNSLMSMYAKCGSVKNARCVFDGLCHRDLVSWNAMLAAYSQQDQPEACLGLYWQMQEEEVWPDPRTFVSVLQACAALAEQEKSALVGGQDLKVMALSRGHAIHADAARRGCDFDPFVGNSLVSMYAKCGDLLYAQHLFDRLPQHDVVSWNAMIAAYAQQDHGEKALKIFKKMQDEDIEADSCTFVTALQACGTLAAKEEATPVKLESIKLESLHKAKKMHAAAVTMNFESVASVRSTLVSMYAKCGSFGDAKLVFDRFSQHDVVSWNAMIAAYVQQRQGGEALQIYLQMHDKGVIRNARTFVSALHACSTIAEQEVGELLDGRVVKPEALENGKRMHAEAARLGCVADIFVGNSLVSMYAKCGSIEDAEEVFYRLSHRDAVSWTAILTAYTQRNDGQTAMEIFQQMLGQDIEPDARTFVGALQACSILAEKEDRTLVGGIAVRAESLRKGKKLHAEAARRGYNLDIFVSNALVNMYSKCGSIKDAEQVFNTLSQCNVVTWTTMISAYIQQKQPERSLQLFWQMQGKGIRPTAHSCGIALQACGAIAEKERSALVEGHNVKVESLQKAKELHTAAVARGFESDIFVGSTLVSVYAICGSIHDAEQLFERFPQHDVVSWSAMIAAYAHQHQGEKSLRTYGSMREAGVRPNAQTFASALQACVSIAQMDRDISVDGQRVKLDSLHKGKKVHADVADMGFESDVFVGSTLISMYAKCGSIMDAQHVFDSLPHRNVVCWNAMIEGYAQQGDGNKALQIFANMQAEGWESDEATYLSVLQACCITGSLDICKNIHQRIVESGLDCNLSVANSLIHTYGKCGSMVDAQNVFDSLAEPDVVSWNTLIGGYAQQGSYETNIHCYEAMCSAGVRPDKVTLTMLLCACSHAGMVDRGLKYFECMTRDHGIAAELEHYVCLLDLVGRAGLFNKAEELLSTMPMQPTFTMWLCLLAACQKHGNVVLGKYAFDGAISVDTGQAAPYVLMSNIYSDMGMWEHAKAMDDLRRKTGAWKKPGQAWIEHRQQVHIFLVGDKRHEQEAQIYQLLRELDVISSFSLR